MHSVHCVAACSCTTVLCEKDPAACPWHPCSELGAFHARWRGRLTPRPAAAAPARAEHGPAPPPSASPAWLQPQLFCPSSYLPPALGGRSSPALEARGNLRSRQRLDFSPVAAGLPLNSPGWSMGGALPHQPPRTSAGRCAAWTLRPASPARGASPLAATAARSSTASGAGVTAAAGSASGSSSPHVECQSTARPSYAHTGTDPMSRPASRASAISLGCQTSPCALGLATPSPDTVSHSTCPHAAWLPPSPGSPHQRRLGEMAAPPALSPRHTIVRHGAATGTTAGPAAASPQHTTMHFMAHPATGASSPTSPLALGPRDWRPLSAGATWSLARGRQPHCRPATSPGRREQALVMLQVGQAWNISWRQNFLGFAHATPQQWTHQPFSQAKEREVIDLQKQPFWLPQLVSSSSCCQSLTTACSPVCRWRAPCSSGMPEILLSARR